jgi:outer membrane immunogenic protein
MRVVAGIAAAAAAVSAAFASDLPVPAGPIAPVQLRPVPSPIFIWTGCHIGGHVGGDLADTSWNGQFVDDLIPSTFGAPTSIAIILPPGGPGSAGVIAGVQGGCDLQVATRFVLGGQADFAGSSNRNSQNVTGNVSLVGFPVPAPTTVTTAATLNEKISYIATATARLGYAYETSGRGLFYLKGGAAWLNASHTFSGTDTTTSCATFTTSCQTFNPAITLPFTFSGSQTVPGWTVGFGWEFAVTHDWSAFMEYDYLSFQSRSIVLSSGLLPSASISIAEHVNELKVGVNYLIGPNQWPRY